MARTGASVWDETEGSVPVHPRLLDTDLPAWAGPGVARGGRQDALLGRVESLRLSLDGRTLDGRVRGNRPLPYGVEVRAGDGGLSSACSCSAAGRPPCRHAVAAVEALRFPTPRRSRAAGRARPGRPGAGKGRIVRHAPAVPGFVLLGGAERTRPRQERLAQAREEEIALRRQRARRRRLRVRPQAQGDGPPRYEVTAKVASRAETVTLRGDGLASCTCGDFAANEIETCEHVERVRTARSRQRKRDRAVVPERLVSLWRMPRPWSDERPDPLREIRLDAPAAALPDFFDADGWLRPAPPDVPGSAWARRAVHAARRWAAERGLTWDLDPAVDELGRDAERAEAVRGRLGGVDDRADVWIEVRDGLRLELHPYQEEGSLLLARRGRAFLADDMGLGKTVQAIAAALLLRRTAGVRRALVVCPASLKHQWHEEIRKSCGEEAVVVEGGPAARRQSYEAWREGFRIVNYELVLRDLSHIRSTEPDLVVLDEAQRIKNWNTQTARAVKQLDSPYAFVLTGTPLENRLHELHSLVEFLHPRALGPRWRLMPFHAVTDARGRVIAYEGLDVLRRKLDGFFLRRERRAVLDQLPERTDNTYWTGMTSVQRRPYRRHAATAAALLATRRPLLQNEVRTLLRALTAMRILCNAHAQYVWEQHEARLGDPRPPDRNELRALHSPKLEEFARVLEDLLDSSDRKVVVFSQWERMLRLAHFSVREVLDRRDLVAGVFHGSLTSRARSELLREFHADPSFRVLFSTDAGGLGLNLQDAASVVVNLEVPWNPAVLEQRIGRVHRLGQRRSVQVLHLVTRGAVEERVLRVVEDKRKLFEGLLADEADLVVFDERARSSFVDRMRTLVDSEAG